jgi:tRNA threonylcarbamoyladenosine biosynthesis protein TsaB
MRVLAFDTSAAICSVALLQGDDILARSERLASGHAERILPMIDEILTAAGVALKALDGLAVVHGPGTFTGVRIAVAVAQGLAFGADLRVAPVSSLATLAAGALERGPDRPVVAAIDARLGEVYWAAFESGADARPRVLVPPRLTSPDELHFPDGRRFTAAGSGFAAFPQLLARAGIAGGDLAAVQEPDARYAVRQGAAALAAGEGLDAHRLEPLYLRDKVALTEAERAAPNVAAP